MDKKAYCHLTLPKRQVSIPGQSCNLPVHYTTNLPVQLCPPYIIFFLNILMLPWAQNSLTYYNHINNSQKKLERRCVKSDYNLLSNYRYHRLIIRENLSGGISYQLNSGIITILYCVPKASRGLTLEITAFQLLGQLINQNVITLSLDLTISFLSLNVVLNSSKDEISIWKKGKSNIWTYQRLFWLIGSI